MQSIEVRTCAMGALMITLVLWFTGLVTVPFANTAAHCDSDPPELKECKP